MRGTGKQFQYILRDEVMHFAFGLKAMNQLLEEENISFDPKAVRECGTNPKPPSATTPTTSSATHPGLFGGIPHRAVPLRRQSPRPHRGPGRTLPGGEERIPWLDEQATMRKEKNFFETRVIEYQTEAQLE